MTCPLIIEISDGWCESRILILFSNMVPSIFLSTKTKATKINSQ